MPIYLNQDKSIQLYYNWTLSSVVFYDFDINHFVAACAQTMDYQLCQTWLFRDNQTNMIRLSTNVRLKRYQFDTNNFITNFTSTKIGDPPPTFNNAYVILASFVIMLSVCGCCCYYQGLRSANKEIKGAVESELKSFLTTNNYSTASIRRVKC